MSIPDLGTVTSMRAAGAHERDLPRTIAFTAHSPILSPT
jgi:hypothetical protein